MTTNGTRAPLRIAAVCGSLRKDSFNRRALAAAATLMPAGMTMHFVEIRDIPLFDGDVLDRGFPAPVAAAREAIRAADGVLFGSPEYNFSVTGVLKNAIDWISRGTDQPFARKPVAIMSATTGPVGGARSQYDLRKTMVFLDAHVLNKPEIFIGNAVQKFDAGGTLADEATRKIVATQMNAFRDFIDWTRRGYGHAQGS
jgi:chromate reductase, NAD(P)H dehydrogenase (quinone)